MKKTVIEIMKCCADRCLYSDTCYRHRTTLKNEHTYDYSECCNEENDFEYYKPINRN